MSDLDVAIVGGGISGLTAARVLCGCGLRVRLFESAPEVGGLIRTERVGDWVIDAGPDALLAHKPAALDLVRELGLGPRLVTPLPRRATYVLRGRSFRSLPETSALGLPTDVRTLVRARAFTWRGRLRMAAEALLPPGPELPDESIGSFVRRRFGREAVAYVAEPVLAGIHRGDADKLSVRALFPMLANAERTHGSVCRAWRAAPRRSTGAGVLSLQGGLGELVASLKAQLPPDVVAASTPVDAVHGLGPYTLQLRGRGLAGARTVIFATPAPATGRLVGTLDPALGALCEAIRHVTSVNVALGYRRGAVRHPLDGWGFVVPRQERRHIRSATWVSSKWPGRTPADHVLIRASVAVDAGHEADASDDALVERAHRELHDLLGVSGDPVLARLYCVPRAMPQLEVGHVQRMAAIDRRLAGLPGIFISAGGFRGVGLPHCIGEAIETASRAVSFLRSGE